jgi:uncharacterized membrane protein YhhN
MAISTIFLVLFIVLSIVHTIGEFLEDGPKLKVRTITKPFLLPLVIAYYLMACSEKNIAPVTLIVIGLALGFVGDVVLMKPKVQILFMIGLGSFLIGHILYIIEFFKAMGSLANVQPVAYVSLIAYAAFFYAMFRYLKADLKEMLPPVLVYMILIITMSFASFALMFSSTTGAVTLPWVAFVGSLNFIASDALLANQLFKKPFKYDQAIIMLTYLIAQLCIAQAFL